MSLFEIGRLAIKIAGRDAGRMAVVIDSIDENHVLIDGQVRRKKCNIRHLEPLPEVIKIRKEASPEEVAAEFKKIGIEVAASSPKPKTERPTKQRKVKEKPVKEKMAKKKEQLKTEQDELSKKKAPAEEEKPTAPEVTEEAKA